MTVSKRWSVDIVLEEDDDERQTRAEAQLHTHSDMHLIGVGTARRNPRDRAIPAIGDEVAAARALFDLGHQLLQTAASDIEEVTHQPAHLHE
jgi:hypothetical protein